MREVKNIIFRAVFAATVCLLATSCKINTEEVDNTIRFGTQTTTRAAISTQQDLEQASQTRGEHIGIYGTVRNALNPTPVEIISNEPLYFDGTDWVYDNTRYWTPGANHEFVAIYPYSATDYTWNAETGTITRNNITLGVANNTDYMWAASSRNLATSPDTTTPVLLEMHHACALLEFWFVNASSHEVSKINDISIENLLYKGGFTCSKDGTSTLTVSDERVPYTSGIYTGNLTQTNIPVDLTKRYNLFDNAGALVVMPQLIEGADIDFNLRISGGEISTFDLSQMSSVGKWEAGNKYVYTIYLTTTEITFDVRVLDWVDDEVELL